MYNVIKTKKKILFCTTNHFLGMRERYDL